MSTPNASTALHKVYKSLVLDINEVSFELENILSGYLPEAPKGLYIHNRIEPIVTQFGEYKVNNKGLLEPYFLGNPIIGEIYNVGSGNPKRVVPIYAVKNPQKFLSDCPILAYFGLKIAYTEIDKTISSRVRYRRYRMTNQEQTCEYGNYLTGTDKDINFDIQCDVMGVLRDTTEALIDFVKGYEDHIIFCNLVGTKVQIDISIDNRAYEWILQKDIEEERKRQES